ncbi:MAG: agmatinase [Sphingomonadales bacterium]|nr:agmatinase [Sphingomonadales bacterium]MBD3774271.1 agmatinase [Paracoccaceae bacterium]
MTIALLGIPHDCNSSFLRGAAQAPVAIREALHSHSANLASETGHDLGDPALLRDAGDLAVQDLAGEAAFDAIRTGVSAALDSGCGLVILGGDHSISHPAILAHAARHPGLSVLHFDAHPDIYADFEGNPFSHASPFARVLESGQLARLVQVGIRTATAHLREQAMRYGVEQHCMTDLSGLPTIAFDGPVYVSIDLDALDPGFAPGVSHHEPGGLATRQIIELIQRVPGRVIGGDVVEYNPARDINGMTAMVAAKLAKELAGRMLDDRTG